MRSGIFELRLEPERAVYRIGDPIRLRVTLFNRTQQDYFAFSYPPYDLSKLRILSDDGHLLAQRSIPGFAMARSTSMPSLLEFPAGKALDEYPDPRDSWKPKEWFRCWGYDLDHPGDYTITAIPTVGAFQRLPNGKSEGQEFVTSPLDISNSVRLKVIK
jgi:hypothetical protein